MYIPKKAPREYGQEAAKTAVVKLYVRRVLINDKFEDLIPRYLSFVKGIVDSDDIPLNVSRESL